MRSPLASRRAGIAWLLAAAAGAARAAGPPLLLGADTASDMLVRIDPTTAAVTVIGPLGNDIISALAYDPNHDILYGFSNADSTLLRVDRHTGATTLVGPLGVTSIHGMEYDSIRNRLFAVTAFGDNSLYSVDVNTGRATLVGPHHVNTMMGIAHDPASDTMYAAAANVNVLYRLDTATGAAVPIGSFNAPTARNCGNGLAWDRDLGLFATDNKFTVEVDDELFRIDTFTGQATAVGPLNTGNCLGLVFIREAAEPCYADCDTGTGPGVLDIFDFLCFQNRFASGAPYACDCDTSTLPGVCDVFDFLCFQNAYAAGCP